MQCRDGEINARLFARCLTAELAENMALRASI